MLNSVSLKRIYLSTFLHTTPCLPHEFMPVSGAEEFPLQTTKLMESGKLQMGSSKIRTQKKNSKKAPVVYMLTDSFDIQTLVIGTGAVASDIWRRSLLNRKPWKWLMKVNHLALHSCPLYGVSSYHFLGRSQYCESLGLYSWWLSLHLCKRQPFLWLAITLPSSLWMNGLFWRAKSCVKTWLRRVF